MFFFQMWQFSDKNDATNYGQNYGQHLESSIREKSFDCETKSSGVWIEKCILITLMLVYKFLSNIIMIKYTLFIASVASTNCPKISKNLFDFKQNYLEYILSFVFVFWTLTKKLSKRYVLYFLAEQTRLTMKLSLCNFMMNQKA